ncbi:MAG: efflux RND transporter periplasmic adaptor subunit [Planctomycetes bacterium]|nr:efflux RND transporter periplasmic adaptor subunit [Planctomycetota bacterium]
MALAVPAAAQFGPAPVSVAPVVEHEVSAGQTFVGTVRPVRRSTIGSAVDGRVVEVMVEDGDQVKKDQPLAQLRTATLEIELAAAKAQLDVMQHELEEWQNGPRREEIDQAKANMLGAQARMEYARSKLKRIQSLVERRAASEDELEDATSAAEAAVQTYAAAKAVLDLAMAGTRPEKLAQARAKVAVQQEEIHRIEDQLTKHTIVSPFDGEVVAKHTEVGQWITQGQAVAEVVELGQVDVEVMVLEDYVAYLRIGTPAQVEIHAVPGEMFTMIPGKVTQVIAQADLRSRNFPVKVRLDNQLVHGRYLIKPGMFARISLPISKLSKSLLVPKDAVVLGGPSPMVYIFEPSAKDPKSGRARPVPVQLGTDHEGSVCVTGDLKAGQQVIVEGNERMRPPFDVRITERAGQPRTAVSSVQAAKGR